MYDFIVPPKFVTNCSRLPSGNDFKLKQFVEVKSGDTFNGILEFIDKFMNIKLLTVIQTSKDGETFHSFKEMMIKGNSIKYFRLQSHTVDKAMEEAEICIKFVNKTTNKKRSNRRIDRGKQVKHHNAQGVKTIEVEVDSNELNQIYQIKMALNDDEFGEVYQMAYQKQNVSLKKFGQKELSAMDLQLKDQLEDELLIGFQEDLPNFEKNPTHNPITMKQINIIQQNSKDEILNTLLSKNIEEVIKRIKKYQDRMQSSDIIVGRVISYVVTQSNDKKVKDYYLDTLQGTKLMKLDLLDRYYLYPGKFIAASIENMDAKEWEITKLHDFPIDQIEEEDVQLDTNKFRRQDAIQIVVAGGPFTFEDSDSYFPLLKLIGKIKAKQIPCDLLILLGPLVDQHNSKILDTDFDELFQDILKMVTLELPRVQILVVNSTNEASSMDALPQPPLKIKIDNIKMKQTNYQLLGNPVRFVLNDSLEIGIINADILSDLGRQCIRKGIEDKEKINWALKQFLEQESYVPVQPCSCNIDWNEMNGELQLNDPFPNIIIMKSRLSPFAKLVDNTVFINSNSMCDNVKGYYGIITFHGNNSGNPKQNIRVDFNILK